MRKMPFFPLFEETFIISLLCFCHRMNILPRSWEWIGLFPYFIDSICSISSQIQRKAAVNTLFYFTVKFKPRGKDHSLSSLWFDISFYYFLPLGWLHCDGRTAWRGNTGTKWPSSASTARAQSSAAAAVKVMMQWKPFVSFSWASGHSGPIFRAVLFCPTLLRCHLNSHCEARSVEKWHPL